MIRELPLPAGEIQELTEQFQTPFHLYDEAGIRNTARKLNQVFDWVSGANGEGYINYYAVKANPNPYVIEIVAEEGMGADASSGPEIQIASAVGLLGNEIMFTANHTHPGEYRRAHESGAILNLDDTSQIDRVLIELDGTFPKTISFRYNPGAKKTTGVNEMIGDPESAKFGVPDELMEGAYRRAIDLGVEHFGMHTMVASNELDAEQHVATARLVFAKIAELSKRLGIPFEFANLGGGLGIPYRPDEQPLDYIVLREGIQQAYEELIIGNGLPPLCIVTENGRHVTGPHGWLITRVTDIKQGYHTDVGVDATTGSDLPRPAVYDAYHEITHVGVPGDEKYMQRVVGSLCEDNDYFTGAREDQGKTTYAPYRGRPAGYRQHRCS
jgi:diaminopimelate decarboxylase